MRSNSLGCGPLPVLNTCEWQVPLSIVLQAPHPWLTENIPNTKSSEEEDPACQSRRKNKVAAIRHTASRCCTRQASTSGVATPTSLTPTSSSFSGGCTHRVASRRGVLNTVQAIT